MIRLMEDDEFIVDERYPAAGRRLRDEPGMPDLMLKHQAGGYRGLFIEMKTPWGKLSGKQRYMIAKLRRDGYAVAVASGCEEAKKIVTMYFDGCLIVDDDCEN
jgi:hypothetical protein